MGVYQRDSRWMVYWHVNGKRHDKSFGRGDLAQAKAQVFDKAVQDAIEHGLPIPDPETTTAADFGEIGHPIRNIRPPWMS